MVGIGFGAMRGRGKVLPTRPETRAVKPALLVAVLGAFSDQSRSGIRLVLL